jgi:signal transduction histidine kinase
VKASPLQSVEAVSQIEAVPAILDTICRVSGMGFAAVARVTEDRWIACGVRDDINFGLKPGDELPLQTTICQEISQSHQAVIISDVQLDTLYCEHPTPALYKFRSYISIPILLPNGGFFGTLCAIDPEPRNLERAEIRGIFELSAALLGFHLEIADQLTTSEATREIERETGELREQFIAVLGHDLRNPLASVQAGVSLLRKDSAGNSAVILGHMQTSIDRMAALIDNVLDFARGRLGGGLSLELKQVPPGPLLSHVVSELAAAHPEREILFDCTSERPVRCDPRRIGQLVSNLVGNAITHGAPDRPIRVHCAIEEEQLSISVANAGVEIPAAAIAKLFHPFVRGEGGNRQEGLGLGLYIASEIASAHGGKLSVQSSAEETRFTFEMPVT